MFIPGYPVPRYIINFDELVDNLKDELAKSIAKALKDQYPQINTDNLESLLEDIKGLLPDVQYKTIAKTINMLIHDSILYGTQKIDGKLLDVPPLIQQNIATFKFDKDVYITGLHFNQTGWKKNDIYSLCINNQDIINESYTKEIGEHKCFNKPFYVAAKTPIDFILDNRSGNSRQTMIDLEYIEVGNYSLPTNPSEDPILGVDDITNDWDVAVEMNWEIGSADIDLHGFIDDTHVWYGNPNETNFYLNWDYQDHMDNANPEVLSVKGFTGKNLSIYIHNFSHTTLIEPINIKIYKKDSSGPIVLKEYNINLPADNTNMYGVCSITLGSLVIVDLTDIKKY